MPRLPKFVWVSTGVAEAQPGQVPAGAVNMPAPKYKTRLTRGRGVRAAWRSRNSMGPNSGSCGRIHVYHFMFNPEWDEGCKRCSFWADNFNGIGVHLNHRDVTLVAVSRAPLTKIEPFRKRMGWSFRWVSSFRSEFNHDYHVSFARKTSEAERCSTTTRRRR